MCERAYIPSSMLRPLIVVGTVPCKLFVLIALQLCSVGSWTHVVRAVGAAAQVTAASKMRATMHLIAHEPKAVDSSGQQWTAVSDTVV